MNQWAKITVSVRQHVSKFSQIAVVSKTCSGAHPASSVNGYRRCFPGGYRQGRWVDESPAEMPRLRMNAVVPPLRTFKAGKFYIPLRPGIGKFFTFYLLGDRPCGAYVQGLPVDFSSNVNWATLKLKTHLLFNTAVNEQSYLLPSVQECVWKAQCCVILWCDLMQYWLGACTEVLWELFDLQDESWNPDIPFSPLGQTVLYRRAAWNN